MLGLPFGGTFVIVPNPEKVPKVNFGFSGSFAGAGVADLLPELGAAPKTAPVCPVDSNCLAK